MKTKRSFALLCALILVFSLVSPVLAAEQQEIIDLGDGFYMVVITKQGPMTRAGDTASGSKTAKAYYGATQIGTYTVIAEFDISGASAKVIGAGINGSGMNGWSYDHGTTSGSGNKATGTAYFSDGSITKAFSLTLTCSPSGVIS